MPRISGSLYKVETMSELPASRQSENLDLAAKSTTRPRRPIPGRRAFYTTNYTNTNLRLDLAVSFTQRDPWGAAMTTTATRVAQLPQQRGRPVNSTWNQHLHAD